tara:strand:- start:371 stop:652 length:282 start_codon:yes stop_codon:yes gene_type:complete
MENIYYFTIIVEEFNDSIQLDPYKININFLDEMKNIIKSLTVINDNIKSPYVSKKDNIDIEDFSRKIVDIYLENILTNKENYEIPINILLNQF